jgi:hypothetical protein
VKFLERTLGPGVQRPAGRVEPGVEGGDGDDPAAVAQRAARVLDEEERPLGVRRHEPVVDVLGHLVDHPRQAAGRVDDHDVQPVQVLIGLPGQPPQVLQAALVGLHGEGPAAGLGDLADHCLRGLVLQLTRSPA